MVGCGVGRSKIYAEILESMRKQHGIVRKMYSFGVKQVAQPFWSLFPFPQSKAVLTKALSNMAIK